MSLNLTQSLPILFGNPRGIYDWQLANRLRPMAKSSSPKRVQSWTPSPARVTPYVVRMLPTLLSLILAATVTPSLHAAQSEAPLRAPHARHLRTHRRRPP